MPGKRANGNGEISRRVTLLEREYRLDRQRWNRNDKRLEKMLSALKLHIENEQERWRDNHERWRKNDARLDASIARLDASLKILHRLMEGR